MPSKFQQLVEEKNRENAHDPHYYKWGWYRIYLGVSGMELMDVKQIWYDQKLPTFAQGLDMLNLIFGAKNRPKVREVWPVLADDANSDATETKCDIAIADDRRADTVQSFRTRRVANGIQQ